MNITEPHDINWHPDHLGAGFEMRHIVHPDDYGGHVRSTVIRRLSADKSQRSVLYVHGFSDYFIQKEMAEMFAGNGYNFYAVDLRKYGRSLLPGQKMFQVRDLHEYFADIDSAIEVMESDGNMEIILLGHSTGGLITSLYMSETPASMIKALILNSPFLDWNLPAAIRHIAMPIVCALGKIMPNVRLRQKPDTKYAETLSIEHGGEWNYRKEWKPDILPDPDMGWARAIHTGQRKLRRSTIDVPVLLMRSSDSVRSGDSKEKYYRADAILDVDAISKHGKNLGRDVTEGCFTGGLHDLALSKKEIRQQMYKTMLEWLNKHGL